MTELPVLLRGTAAILDHPLINSSPRVSAGVLEVDRVTQEWLSDRGYVSPEWHCNEIARSVCDALRSLGLPARILEGEIRLSDGDFLQHRAAYLEEVGYALFLDGTASQFPAFENVDVIGILTEPNGRSLFEGLRKYYSWC